MAFLGRIVKIVVAVCLLFLSFSAGAKSEYAELAPLMGKVDSKSALFIMNLMQKKGELIDNDRYFGAAKKQLPVSFKKYTLEDMRKQNGVLFLKLNTTDEKVPLLWKNHPQKFLEKFHKGTCKAFRKGGFKTIREITVSFHFENRLITSQTQKASGC